jgi:predicted alpha-1,2-mannosidase
MKAPTAMDSPSKNKISIFLISIALLLIAGCSEKKERITRYVDPLIGTDAHGHVYPGAAVPFGMVQLSPDTRKDSWDGCSGYHYSDSTIMGFSHTHLSGTGVGDYGDIRFMPTTGAIITEPGTEENPDGGYRSRFSHKNETASAGYYSVLLDDYNIRAELTVTPRAGFHRYTFPGTDQANIIIDLTEGVTSDKLLELWIEIISDTEIQGLRRTSGWSEDQYLFFNAKFSKPFKRYGLIKDGVAQSVQKKVEGDNVKAWLTFATKADERVKIKVGISAVSTENARMNREEEIKGWDFEKIRRKANNLWHNELKKIEVETDNTPTESLQVFYTALYHALLNPNLYSDVDGSYRGHDNEIHTTERGSNYYTVFSLWDTYRAAHPLLTLLDEKRTNDFVRTMLLQYQQGGLLPVWELAANETNCMIGYHAVSVIADAYAKGIRDYDTDLALEACVTSAMQDQFGLKWYKELGYIPSDEESESVSKTLEYAYDDWCIAQFAKEMGEQEVYETMIKRAQNYKNIYDPQTKFMRAKLNGMWFSPFDAHEVNFNYTEANAWQYNFYAPQDVSGLMQLMGGSEVLAAQLDSLFTAPEATTGRHQSDITGLIGQYAHGNEPSHHAAYLYNYCGQPWKTQALVRKIMRELYTHQPDGLCGNEDCGQMSAWYVMSAMGFYPVTPGSNIYAIGSPAFASMTLHLENGKKLVIESANFSEKNVYIQTATLNGKVLPNSYLTHKQIMEGGLLRFEMGAAPNKAWGSRSNEIPVSTIDTLLITPVPFVAEGASVFYDSQQVALSCADPSATIYFSTDATWKMEKYETPFSVSENTIVNAYAEAEGKMRSYATTSRMMRITNGRTITLKSAYANQYNAGGDVALIDYQRGGADFRTGRWQGYYGVDLEAIVDLGKSQSIQSISMGFLQDIDSWIFMPQQVDFFTSADAQNWRLVGKIGTPVEATDPEPKTADFRAETDGAKARYIKVVAHNIGQCPDWHKGAGDPAWIFADEIVIEGE